VIHPDTTIRAVDPRIGVGVVATKPIAKGTITWVHDELDQAFSAQKLARLGPLFHPAIDRYSYRDGDGHYVLCWDHARFVNHSCSPTCMAPGFDLEIAIRDIQPGEQLTGDYATYNFETEFTCFCGAAECRGRIGGAVDEAIVRGWDSLLRDAFPHLGKVEQPLWPLVREKHEIELVLADPTRLPSARTHLLRR
jgi:hypothetical protein